VSVRNGTTKQHVRYGVRTSFSTARLTAYCALFCIVSGSFALPTARAGDPTLKWRTLKTAHFYIHYYKKERAVARRVAVICERVHRLLTPLMKWHPRRRTHVVLTDDTDSANGLAQVIPRSVVRLYVTAPADMETLNDYDDWLYFLFMHEYTHILHLNTRGGLADVINIIFGLGRGIMYAPNHVQPRWFIEGMAVLNESMRTTGGRIRSSLYNMILRAAVLENKPFSLAELSSSTIRYPHGRAQYLYGAFFIHYIYQKYGMRSLVNISHDYGDEPLPFGLNKVARRHLKGKGYLALYKEWLKRLKRRFAATTRLVKKRGLRHGKKITRTGETAFYPQFHPRGDKVVFMESDGHWEQAFKLIPARGGKKKKLTRVESGGASSWTPDGKSLVFSQMEIHKAVYAYSDLFRWDLAEKRIVRLTRGLRAREPDVSPDGRRIVFTVNRLGRRCLAVMPLDRGSDISPITRNTPRNRRGMKTIWCGSRKQDQAFTPKWSPDGKRIVFSAWTHGGYRDLYLFDTTTQKVRRLTHDRALDTNPHWSPNGRWIYFASDRTEIYNIYARDLKTRQTYQVTNVLTGAFHPAISPDGKTLVYVGFCCDGYDLYSMKLDPENFLRAPISLPTRRRAPERGSDRTHKTKTPDRQTNHNDAGNKQNEDKGNATNKPLTAKTVILSDEKYNPLWTLAPETWWATLEDSTVTLTLNGQDVVGHHYWSATGAYNYDSEGGNMGIAYSYNRLWPSISGGVYYSDSKRTDWKINGENHSFRAYDVSFNIGTNLPLLRSYRWGYGSFLLRYRFEKWDGRTEVSAPIDPAAPLPEKPEFGRLSGLALSWSYAKTRAYTYSVSPEKGRSIGLTVTINSEQLGSDYETAGLSWRWTEYLPMPWLRHHVLALRYAGGMSWGHPRFRPLYSIGGFGQQDLVRALIDQTMVVGASLRGYDPTVAVGDHYHLVNAEYRFPICWVNWAPWTVPLFFRRLWGTVFVDWGDAFFDEFKPKMLKDFRWGSGAELLLQLYIGYYQAMTLRLGYAYGFNEGGGHRYYLFFGVPLS
jgi:Tol biopolymer transport system component